MTVEELAVINNDRRSDRGPNRDHEGGETAGRAANVDADDAVMSAPTPDTDDEDCDLRAVERPGEMRTAGTAGWHGRTRPTAYRCVYLASNNVLGWRLTM